MYDQTSLYSINVHKTTTKQTKQVMDAIVINKTALSFIDMQKLENIHTIDTLTTVKVFVINMYGEITNNFIIRDFELKDILEEIPSKYKMILH